MFTITLYLLIIQISTRRFEFGNFATIQYLEFKGNFHSNLVSKEPSYQVSSQEVETAWLGFQGGVDEAER